MVDDELDDEVELLLYLTIVLLGAGLSINLEVRDELDEAEVLEKLMETVEVLVALDETEIHICKT